MKYNGSYYTQLTSLGSTISYEYGINYDSDEVRFHDSDQDEFITVYDSPTVVGRNRITWPLHEINIYAETYAHKASSGGGEETNLERINITLNMHNTLRESIADSEIQLTVIYENGEVATTIFAPSVPANASRTGIKRTIYINPNRRDFATILVYSDESYTLSVNSTNGNGGEGKANSGVGLTDVYLENDMVIDIEISRGV